MGIKKMGRPTDSPKETQFTVRLDEETNKKLKACSKQLNVSQAEVIRASIHKTYDDLNEK